MTVWKKEERHKAVEEKGNKKGENVRKYYEKRR